jgi:LCP family protein required for cell wall assembly
VPAGKVRRPRRAARILSWIAIVTSLSVLATAGAGYALLNHYNGRITRIHGLLDHSKPPAPHHAENFLLVGSDSRGNLKAGQGVQGTGADFVTGQRSDTVILAHLFGGSSNKVEMISFPRDSVVEIPAYTDPKTGKVHNSRHDRINSAFAEGGPKLLIDTIQQLSGVRVDHYLQVDFEGFQRMVDKLGGVDVCLSQPAKDHFSGINLSAGKHHVNGAVALSFVRQRHGLTNGDIDRIKRQQQFIGAMVRKVLSAGTLGNPFKLNGFLDVATSSLKADDNLDFASMRKLALRLRNLGAGNVAFTTVPVANINGYDPVLGSVVLLDQAKTAALFDQIRSDIPPGTPKPKPSTAAGKAPLIVRPGAIRVHVYNGSGINGLGRKAAGELANLGFQTVGTPETRGSGAAATLVRYGPSKADSARTLAAAIPGATLQAAPDLGNVLEVVVGTSYTGARPVTISSVAPTTEPSASPPPRVVTAQDDPCAA